MEERTVLVVADGGGVRIFLEGHRGGPLSEKTAELGVPHPHAPASGSPGRVFDRFGHASHGVTGEPPRDKVEREFLDALAHRIEGFVADCDAANVVIMAPPRALGVLREALPVAVQRLLRASEAKDRLDATPDVLRAALRELRRTSP